MTPKEFEHRVMVMRSQALSAARQFGLSTEEAEDVAQDVMLRLWVMHERIRAKDTAGWLARIAARHACIDRLRMRDREQFELSEADIERGTPYDALEYKELEQWFFQEIEQLPTTCGIILRMRQLEHRDINEIATLIGITPESVSSLLSRARRQLIEKYEKRKKSE